MTEQVSSSPVFAARSTARQRSEPVKKRPRTVYRLHRRYLLLSRLAGFLGGAVGIALIASGLGPSIAAGDRLPLSTFGVAALIVAGLTLVPYVLVRWWWRVVKASLDD